jgi:hypothetical protein
MPVRFFNMNPKMLFILAFAICIGSARATDERSISDLRNALVKLSPDVDPGEAELLSLTAHITARNLAREYGIVLNPEFHNFLINIGSRQRGYCAHWARDIGARLKELKPETLMLHWGAAYAGTTGEHNVVVVTARNQPFQDGIIIDGWRRAGRLFWCAIKKDEEYGGQSRTRPLRPEAVSRESAWKEDLAETAWLQDYGPGEQKSKMRERNSAFVAAHKPVASKRGEAGN